MSVNSILKATNLGQRKAFYRQRIPQSSCARKDIFVRSRNADKKSCDLAK